MTQKMLVDALYGDELRVAVVADGRLKELDLETSTKKQHKGNIYLARVIRVEPSLRAAFLDFGGNRHGFLAFSEIHPAYYRFPPEKLSSNTEAAPSRDHHPGSDMDEKSLPTFEDKSAHDDAIAIPKPASVLPLDPIQDIDISNDSEAANYTDISSDSDSLSDSEHSSDEDSEGDEDELKELKESKIFFSGSWKNYRIQDVIERQQVMLVQVVRDERSSKGAALTTYISLAGRYCVLMPNTPRGGGVSRKITQTKDRQRLKDFLAEIPLPSGMGLIVRTAGSGRTKTEIKRDCDYLVRLWNTIREKTLLSVAPSLVHAEADLMTRAIRDMYTREIDEIWVEGEEGYKKIRSLMRLLMPSHTKKVQIYKDKTCSLFHRYGIEDKIYSMHAPIVPLPSGGYLVINPAEALTAIDVNSGKATRERSIEETALKTNEEAAEEIARQIRLRQLAGLIAIDFIDMEKPQSVAKVEKRFRESIRGDRAKIHILPISSLGILELSRQRLRPTLLEVTYSSCPHCCGAGIVPSLTTTALRIMRGLSDKLKKIEPSPHDLPQSKDLTVKTSQAIASYVLNEKRNLLNHLEVQEGCHISIVVDPGVELPDFEIFFTHAPVKPLDISNSAKKETSSTERPDKSLGRRRRNESTTPGAPPPQKNSSPKDKFNKPGSCKTPNIPSPEPTEKSSSSVSGSIIDSIIKTPGAASQEKPHNATPRASSFKKKEIDGKKSHPPQNNAAPSKPTLAKSVLPQPTVLNSVSPNPKPANSVLPTLVSPALTLAPPSQDLTSSERVPDGLTDKTFDSSKATTKPRRRRRRSRHKNGNTPTSESLTIPTPPESPPLLMPPEPSAPQEEASPSSASLPQKGWWKRLLDT